MLGFPTFVSQKKSIEAFRMEYGIYANGERYNNEQKIEGQPNLLLNIKFHKSSYTA